MPEYRIRAVTNRKKVLKGYVVQQRVLPFVWFTMHHPLEYDDCVKVIGILMGIEFD